MTDKNTTDNLTLMPHLPVDDLPREKLLELLKLYGRLYLAMDGFWFLSVRQHLGNQAALDCDIATWARMSAYEMSRITRLMDIKGQGLSALLQALRLAPWFLNLGHQVHIDGDNRAVLSVNSCPTLIALEKEGEGREKEICRVIEPIILKSYASFFDPGIVINCLKCPPRSDREDGTCCQWEFIKGR
ncbi:MAG: hypothetical protein HYX96_05570 [Chloroflexi bacterium]|nr:hypothetical protein [Chloroflexota bacterium]